ncbi:RNI-like protein [Gonapodya prolifera JEL478]|uniref:RNI-like protein n=1 Tax=Gonapodya prolifera (strain JEL478) TaxID=1344416 RepID=A0A139ADT2_GONPJ|nr:RNI-like protein [Gonapodya prolifera JEL478]|eukprot:KXS14986.1 RNI-like protein [Gonapodya prolifera JEL478]
MCIKIVCENIDYVEKFGDIPHPAKIRIGKILSKQRTLNTENIRLFLTHTDDTVKLTDCTRVDEAGLRQVGIYAPNLRVLELGFCGRMTDDALSLICQRCPFIDEMQLQGPFLVTDDGFSTIFQTFGRHLKRFSLEDSPKITTKSVLSIISACNPSSPVLGPSGKAPHDGLSVLRFVRCSSLEDTALLAMASLGCPLQQLDLVGLNEKSTTDNGVVEALAALGASLWCLDLSWNPKLGDATALAIPDRCPNIREVGLAGCVAVTNKGLVEMLESLNASMQDGDESRGLTKVDFARLPMGVVDDEVAGWIEKRCGAVLRLLNLNDAGAITRDALESLISSAPHLWSIDLSWVRCVDDEAIESLIETARELREVKVFGCNKVTDLATKRKWKNDEGSVVKIVGCEFE